MQRFWKRLVLMAAVALAGLAMSGCYDINIDLGGEDEARAPLPVHEAAER